MEFGQSLKGAVRVSVVTVLSGVLLTQTPAAQTPSAPEGAEARPLVAKLDRETCRQRLRAAGTLFQVGSDFFGDVLIDFLNSQALTIIQPAVYCK
jgi:hypothetical protein